MYLNGGGFKQERAQAMKWYKKAAEQGDKDAQAALEKLGKGSKG